MRLGLNCKDIHRKHITNLEVQEVLNRNGYKYALENCLELVYSFHLQAREFYDTG